MTLNEQTVNQPTMPMIGHGTGFYTEMQQQVANQVGLLGRTFGPQEPAVTPSQFSDLRERTELLIAAFYEQSKHTVQTEERFERQREMLAEVKATVQSLCDAQQHWQTTVDQLIDAVMCLSEMTGK